MHCRARRERPPFTKRLRQAEARQGRSRHAREGTCGSDVLIADGPCTREEVGEIGSLGMSIQSTRRKLLCEVQQRVGLSSNTPY